MLTQVFPSRPLKRGPENRNFGDFYFVIFSQRNLCFRGCYAEHNERHNFDQIIKLGGKNLIFVCDIKSL